MVEPRWIRLLLFGIGALYLQLGPGLLAATGKGHDGLMTWRMYHSKGQDTCDVRFHTESGPIEDWPAILELDWRTTSRSRRVLDGPVDTRNIAKRLCLALKEPVYARGRCGTPAGTWEPVFDGAKPLCRGER